MNTSKKMIYVTRSSMPPMEEYINEIKELWESHYLTNMGTKHEQFVEMLKVFLGGVENIDLLTNGHMALELALQAMNLTGEVITTPFTFVSTTHAIVRNGLKPVFCDINPNDYTIDVNKIEQMITDKTSAILPVHVYGNVCDVEGIQKIADKYGLKVIYDAAHAFGVKYKNIGIGKFGDASCFSFHATKVFNTIEGGAVIFRNKAFSREICRLRNFGIKNEEIVDAIGVNAKMNEFCAAMGLCNLRHIDEEIKKRSQVVQAYIANLKDIPGLRLNYVSENVLPNYSYFPVLFEKEFGTSRDEVYDRLIENGFMARKYFYPLTNGLDCYKESFDVSLTPVALHVSETVLTLPLYADLSVDDVDKICNVIRICRK